MPYPKAQPLPDDFKVVPIVPRKSGPGYPPAKKKGQINRITRDLKHGIIDAAVNIGRDGLGEGGLTGFLEDLALNHKRAFAQLLARVLPLQVNPDGIPGAQTNIQIVAVPSGWSVVDNDEVVETPPPPVIEHTPPEPELTPLEQKLLAMSHEELLKLAEAFHVGN